MTMNIIHHYLVSSPNC